MASKESKRLSYEETTKLKDLKGYKPLASDWSGLRYWKLWHASGGSEQFEDYIKDSASNFALISSLMLTFTWPTVTSPPEMPNPVPFLALNTLASGFFTFILGTSVFIIKDHQACTSIEARLKHLNKFGIVLFTINPLALMTALGMLFTAQLYQVYDVYKGNATLLGCSLFNMMIVVLLLPFLYLYMIKWTNDNCYGPDMEEFKKTLDKED